MFNAFAWGASVLLSWLVLIVAAVFVLYVLAKAFMQVTGRQPASGRTGMKRNVVFAASEPEKKAPDPRKSGSRRP